MNLSDYILLPREKRIEHIDLSTPCDLSGSPTYSTRKLIGFNALLNHLGIESDVLNRRQEGIYCTHHCPCDSTHGWCLNPLHVSFGTRSENCQMMGPAALSDKAKRAWITQGGAQAQAKRNIDKDGWNLKLTSPTHVIYHVESCQQAADIVGCSRPAITAGLKQYNGLYAPTRGKNVGWTFELISNPHD